MFFIPSKQIPSVFDHQVVLHDFRIICQRASQLASGSTVTPDFLFDILTQAAEDELNDRFQDAINQSTTSSTEHKPILKDDAREIPTTPIKKVKKIPIRCSVPNCTVKTIKKPQFIQNNPYCSMHFKEAQRKIQDDQKTIEQTKPLSLEGVEDVFQSPKPLYHEAHDGFWKFSSFRPVQEAPDTPKYRIHKATQLIVLIHAQDNPERPYDVELVGRYQNDTLVDKSLLEDYIIDWCIESGLTL